MFSHGTPTTDVSVDVIQVIQWCNLNTNSFMTSVLIVIAQTSPDDPNIISSNCV